MLRRQDGQLRSLYRCLVTAAATRVVCLEVSLRVRLLKAAWAARESLVASNESVFLLIYRKTNECLQCNPKLIINADSDVRNC